MMDEAIATSSDNAMHWSSSDNGRLSLAGMTYGILARVPILQWANSPSPLIGHTEATATSLGLTKKPDSEIVLYTGNGHGSSGTNTRRFTTVGTNVGTGLTLTQSSTNGDSITVGRAMIASITYIDRANGYFNGARFGISKNASSLTTTIESLAAAQILGMVFAGEAAANAQGATGTVTITARLSAGDILRATTDTNPDNATASLVRFHVTELVRL